MKKLLSGLFFALVLALPISVQAHVLVSDEQDSKGAILHVSPDDDPIAGEESDLFFDLQDDELDADYVPYLSIANEDGQVDDVDVEKDANFVTAVYTFPYQGTYQLSLRIESGNESHTYEMTQEVTRGAVRNSSERQVEPWAYALFGLALGGLMVLLLALVIRKK